MNNELMTMVNNPEQHLFNQILRLADSLPDSLQHQKLLAQALEAAASMQELLKEQAEQIRRLTRLSTCDPLTGIMNRRGFEIELDHVLERASRYGEEGALIYIDLDHFKPINDRFGHAAGDAVLREVARVLRRSVRGTDYVARLGGDEFVVLLVNTTREQAVRRAGIIREQLSAMEIDWMGRKLTIGASIGVRFYDRHHCDRSLLEEADQAMYEEKERHHREIASLTGYRARRLEAVAGG